MATVLRTTASGGGVLAESLAVPVGSTYRVLSVMVNLNAAPTASENLSIDLDCGAGPGYDTQLYAVNLGAGSVQDLVWQPDGDLYLVGGDALDVTWANSNSRTWGLLITAEVA